MKLLEKVQKIPGGLMLVPMLAGAIVHTWFPEIVAIGNPATAVFSSKGTMCVVGIMLVFAGIQATPGQVIKCLRRCGVLILIKLILNFAAGFLALRLLGKEGAFGISTLAFAAALTSCNPGVYIALMSSIGDEIDRTGFALVNLAGLPFVPVCILGYASGNGIDTMSILATCAPFLLGMLIGCIDPSFRMFTQSGTAIMLPFLGFCLGNSIDLKLASSMAGSGFLLYIAVTALNDIPLIFTDRVVLGQKGYCSAAICCVAGLAVTVPSLMAEADASFAPYVEKAASQIAFAVILSTCVTPVLAKKLAGSNTRKANTIKK